LKNKAPTKLLENLLKIDIGIMKDPILGSLVSTSAIGINTGLLEVALFKLKNLLHANCNLCNPGKPGLLGILK